MLLRPTSALRYVCCHVAYVFGWLPPAYPNRHHLNLSLREQVEGQGQRRHRWSSHSFEAVQAQAIRNRFVHSWEMKGVYFRLRIVPYPSCTRVGSKIKTVPIFDLLLNLCVSGVGRTLDVDGTLLNSKQALTQPTERAVREAAAAGVLTVVATGKVLGPVVTASSSTHSEAHPSYRIRRDGLLYCLAASRRGVRGPRRCCRGWERPCLASSAKACWCTTRTAR